MTRFVLGLLAPLACCCLLIGGHAEGEPAAAPPDDPSTDILTNTWSTEEECPATLAREIDFETLALHADRFVGECVRTSGVWAGRALYRDIAGYYRAGPGLGRLRQGSEHGRIGLYGRDDVMNDTERPEVAFASITGRVGLCAQLGSGFMMVMGYCHYVGGPFIAIASASAASGKFRRQTGEKARRQFGNLVPLTGRWPDRSVVDPLAMRWMRDIQKGDIADFASLHDIQAQDIDLNNEEGLLYAVFTSPTSAFAAFRGRTDAPAPVYFKVLEPAVVAEDDEDESDYRSVEFVACFCREARCDRRWPIAKFDSANDPNRPYACLTIRRETERNAPKDRVETELDWRRSIEEPAFARQRRRSD